MDSISTGEFKANLQRKDNVEITEEFANEAVFWHRQAVNSTSAMIVSLKQIYDNQYYRAFGFTKFYDYLGESLAISKSQAHEYMRVIESFNSKEISSAPEMSLRKLSQLSRLPEATRRALMSGEPVEFPDGHIYTEAEVQALTAKQVEKAVKPFKQKLTDRDGTIESLNQQIQEMRDDYDRLEAQGADSAALVLKQRRIEEYEHQLAVFMAFPANIADQLNRCEKDLDFVLRDINRLIGFVRGESAPANRLSAILHSADNKIQNLTTAIMENLRIESTD